MRRDRGHDRAQSIVVDAHIINPGVLSGVASVAREDKSVCCHAMVVGYLSRNAKGIVIERGETSGRHFHSGIHENVLFQRGWAMPATANLRERQTGAVPSDLNADFPA